MGISHRWVCCGGWIGLSVLASSCPAEAHELAVTSPQQSHIHPSEPSLSQTENSATNPSPSPRLLKENKESPLRNRLKSPKKSPFDALIDVIFGRFSRPGTTKRTSRGVCAIAPGLLETKNTIFSDRPLFVWQGNVGTIEVQDYWTGNIITSASLAPGVTSWQYSAAPSLQPGEVYIWTLKQGAKTLITKEFMVMPHKEREQVIQQKTLERPANSLESISLLDASYFSKHKLWSDTLTSLYEEPDDGRASLIQERIYALGEQLCNEEGDEEDGVELARELSQ